MSDAPKPCPFCGRRYVGALREMSFDTVKYFVSCQRCVCRGPQSLEVEICIDLWNKAVRKEQETGVEK